jgi:gliding motility-associated-like protein
VVGTDLCSETDTLVVYHDTTNYIEAPQDPLIVCRPAYVNLQSIAHGPAPLANLFCGTADPVQCLAQDQDTATIGTGSTPPAITLNTPFHSDSVYQKYQFIIPKRDLLNAGLYSGTINALAFKTLGAVSANAAENITISLACVPYEEFEEPVTNGSFVTGTPVATLTSYALTANDWNQINFAAPYSWDTTTNLLVDLCIGPMPGVAVGTTDPVAMMDGMAIQKISNTINVCGGNGLVRTYAQQPVIRFMYCPSPELPFEFTWRPGSFLSDSNAQNPTVYVPRTIDYAVYSVGRNGCLMRDSLHITVPEHNISVLADTSVCLNQPAYLLASGGEDGYQWFEVQNDAFTSASGSLSCTDCANPVALPQATTKYAVVFSNNVHQSNEQNDNYETGCPDTLFTTVNVWPLPPVHSSNRDTTIGYGKSLRLYATGASNFTWTPVGSLDNPNSPSPMASPTQTTNYIVSGMDSNGCVSRDTVKVTVDYTNNLLIPSGFTPNGDGRNDVFKVVNPSFQRLMEFRVFNRWGQEVFSTTDIFDGWDGKWKGVEQGIGNYQYLIRVAYPDGKTETYKGDINLIR